MDAPESFPQRRPHPTVSNPPGRQGRASVVRRSRSFVSRAGGGASALAVVTVLLVGAFAGVVGAAISAGSHTGSERAVAASPEPVFSPAVVHSPLAIVKTIEVGGLPEFGTYDPITGEIYIPNWANGNVSVINGTSVAANPPAGGIPFSATYDAANHDVYVVNEASNNVTVLHGDHVVANVPTGTAPRFASYDSANGLIYVDNTRSASVTVINGTAVQATIHVGTDPSRPVVGGTSGGGGGGGWDPALAAPAASATSLVYVPNSGSNNVTVIGGPHGTSILGSTNVGLNPQFAAWDPSNVWLYVANNNSSSVSVLSDASPYAVLYTVHVGLHPFSASYNATTKEVFVVNYGSGNVSVLGGALVNKVVATIPVGAGPEFLTQIPNPIDKMVVPNTVSGNVSVLAGTKDVESLDAGAYPVYATVDPKTGLTYVQNFLSSNVTVLGAAPMTFAVTFKEHGLPSGVPWSVTAGSPPQTLSDTTVGSSGEVTFEVPGGALLYSFTVPSGYGPAKIRGPGLPSLTEANITVPTTFTVTFGPIENLTFSETGLPNGTSWGVSLRSSLPHGGPAPHSLTATTSAISFAVVKGSWKFQLTVPDSYKAKPSKGSVGVPTHAVVKNVKFALLTTKVTFTESGLKKGTLWSVNVSGPMSCAPSGTKGKLVCLLETGNYTFTVGTVPGELATPASGNFTVSGVGSQAVSIAFSSSGGLPTRLATFAVGP